MRGWSDMKVVAPFEAGLVAGNVETLLAFYQQALACTVLTAISVAADVSRRSGLSANGYRVVRLETRGGDRFKLAQPLGDCQDAVRDPHPISRVGCAYLTFIVDDLASIAVQVQAAGGILRSDGVVTLRPGVSMCLATDPEGNWLEFVHYDDIRSYRPAAAPV